MTGRTYLILKALQEQKSVEAIAKEFKVSKQRVYAIAGEHDIKPGLSTKKLQVDKKERKKNADAKRYLSRRKESKESIGIILPVISVKRRSLSLLGESWALSQGSKRSSADEHYKTQVRYGLRTPRAPGCVNYIVQSYFI